MDYSSTYPWAKKDLVMETFVYTFREKNRNLRVLCNLSKTDEILVRVVHCELDELVSKDESCDSSSVYSAFFTTQSLQNGLFGSL